MLMREGSVLCSQCKEKIAEKLVDEAPDANLMSDEEIKMAEVVVAENGTGNIRYFHGLCYHDFWKSKPRI